MQAQPLCVYWKSSVSMESHLQVAQTEVETSCLKILISFVRILAFSSTSPVGTITVPTKLREQSIQ